MRKVLSLVGLVALGAVIIALALTIAGPSKKTSHTVAAPAPPYTTAQASTKIAAYYAPKLSSKGASVAGVRCASITKDSSGQVKVDPTGKSPEFVCVLNVVITSTGQAAACEGITFSLPAGASAPKVDGAQSLDPATYCSGA